MTVPDSVEFEPQSRVLEHLPRLVGMDVVPVDQALELVRTEECAIVRTALPEGSIVVSPVDPAESLVVLAAANNLKRVEEPRVIYVEHNGETYVGRPQGTAEWYGRLPKYRFYKAEDEHFSDTSYRAQSHAITVTPVEPWATTREGLSEAIALSDTQNRLRKQFVEEHPLGEGALLITNRYGGIDPTKPSDTARSLLTRFIYANELGIPDEMRKHGAPGPFVEHGLLDPRLEGLLGESWIELRHKINPSLAIIEQMREAGLDPAPVMDALQELVKLQVEEFLERWGSSIMLAAQLLQDSQRSNTVLDALASTDQRFADSVRNGSFNDHRIC